jgi:hypothetical protein
MNGQGCGLGLAISHKLAIGLGFNGKFIIKKNTDDGIKVYSKVDRGSSFSFIIENKSVQVDLKESCNISQNSLLDDDRIEL